MPLSCFAVSKQVKNVLWKFCVNKLLVLTVWSLFHSILPSILYFPLSNTNLQGGQKAKSKVAQEPQVVNPRLWNNLSVLYIFKNILYSFDIFSTWFLEMCLQIFVATLPQEVKRGQAVMLEDKPCFWFIRKRVRQGWVWGSVRVKQFLTQQTQASISPYGSFSVRQVWKVDICVSAAGRTLSRTGLHTVTMMLWCPGFLRHRIPVRFYVLLVQFLGILGLHFNCTVPTPSHQMLGDTFIIAFYCLSSLPI